MSRLGKSLLHLIDRFEVDRCVFANRGMRTAAGFHAHDALGRQCLAAHEELHVFAREDVIGDDGKLVLVAHRLAEAVEQCGLAGTDRAAHTDFYRTSHIRT